MPFMPVMPPQPVAVFGGFDYVTVDAQRRRVYAAHGGSQRLLVVDADSGKVLSQIRVGPLHGVAVDPSNGHVYTGDGNARTVSDVDPVAGKVVRSVDVDGEIDAVIFDPATGRILADEDNGTRIFVIDSATMKQTAVVKLPGHKPEYLAVDPVTHDIYQNIADQSQFVVVDGKSLTVKKTVATPDAGSNHPLQYDAGRRVIVLGGNKGMLLAYDPGGTLVGSLKIQNSVDQCDLDPLAHVIACAGGGTVTVASINADRSLTQLGTFSVARGVHTLAIDSKTQRVFVVWAEAGGDFVQAFALTP